MEAILIRLLLFFIPFCLFAEFSYFIPPAGWQGTQPKAPSPHVQIGFVGQGKSGFHPSINLAVEEEVDVSLKDYVKAVKEIHLSQSDTKWRDLGPLSMKGGKGQLTEISTSSPWGPVQMLQALLVHENKAYILTAAVLKKEFPTYRKEILQSLKSLAFAENAIASLADVALKEKLEHILTSSSTSKKEQKKQWKDLQHVVKECNDMGAHWQFLVLKEGHAKIFSEAK